MRVFKQSALMVVMGLVLASTLAWGREGMQKGTGEVAGTVGIYHESGLTKAILGGTGGYNVSDRVQAFGNFNYIPVGSGANAVELGGGIDISLGKLNKKIIPYIPLNLGLQHAWSRGTSANVAVFGGGFGTRIFLGKQWGVRPEFTYQRAQKSDHGWNTGRFGAGLFYQFGK